MLWFKKNFLITISSDIPSLSKCPDGLRKLFFLKKISINRGIKVILIFGPIHRLFSLTYINDIRSSRNTNREKEVNGWSSAILKSLFSTQLTKKVAPYGIYIRWYLINRCARKEQSLLFDTYKAFD